MTANVWESIKAELKNKPQVGQIVHLGAGLCAELETYIALNPEHVVLVEALVDSADKLSARCKEFPNVNVLNQVVSEEAERAFYRVQPREFSSALDPAWLTSVFPNMQIEKLEGLNQIAFNELLAQSDLDEGKDNILVLQLNGTEQELLAENLDQICQFFSYIIVQTYRISGSEVIPKAICNDDTICALASDQTGALISLSLFKIDKQKLELANLKQQNDALLMLLDEAEQRFSATESKHEFELQNVRAQNKTLTDKLAVLNSQLQDEVQKNSELQQDLQSTASQSQEIEGELEVLKSERTSRENELIAQLDCVNGEKENVQALLDEKLLEFNKLKEECSTAEEQWRKNNEGLTKVSEEAKQKAVDLEAELNTTKQEVEKLSQQLSEASKKLEEKDKQNALSQQMLAKSQVDLDDLRNSYSKKHESERKLIELVKELREKLAVASQYYFKLQQDHPELIERNAVKDIDQG